MATRSVDPGAGLRRHLLADQVHDAVLDLLVDGDLPPGEPLGIDALARRFGVSPTPVREALARLKPTGLVEHSALRGYRAAPMTTPEELGQLMDARLLLEPALAELAAGLLDEAVVTGLEQAVTDQRSASRGPSFHDYRPFWEADERFHRLVAEATGNAFLVSSYEALGGQIRRFRLFGARGVTDADHCIAEHTRVLAALRTRDGALARTAMATHIRDARDRALASAVPEQPRSSP